MNICIFGSGSRNIDSIYTDCGYRLGCEIAKNGHTLVFGGGSKGMMGSCARGVHENNGKIIGISPEWINDLEKLYSDCSEFIYVDTISERKKKFIEKSDAFIITPGGVGTLDEFFEIITLKKLKQQDKEIIVFNINNFFDKMFEMLGEMDKQGFRYKESELYKTVSSIDEIFKILNEHDKNI